MCIPRDGENIRIDWQDADENGYKYVDIIEIDDILVKKMKRKVYKVY